MQPNSMTFFVVVRRDAVEVNRYAFDIFRVDDNAYNVMHPDHETVVVNINGENAKVLWLRTDNLIEVAEHIEEVEARLFDYWDHFKITGEFTLENFVATLDRFIAGDKQALAQLN